MEQNLTYHMHIFGAQGFNYYTKLKRQNINQKPFWCMIFGYAHDLKGNVVFNLISQRLEIMQSGILQELLKSKHV